MSERAAKQSQTTAKRSTPSSSAAPQSATGDFMSIEQLQRTFGNQTLQRMLADGRVQPVTPALYQVQRQAPAPATGMGTPPAGPAPDDPRLTNLLSMDSIASEQTFNGSRFHAEYEPNSGRGKDARPVAGKLTITLRLHVNFKNFSEVRREEPYKNMRFSREQREDFDWKPTEETTFRQKLKSSIESGWGVGKLQTLTAVDPNLSDLNAAVHVVVDANADEGDAHNVMTALKVPKGAPRFRSFVSGDGTESTLERRDVEEREDFVVTEKYWRIGPFAHDDDGISSVQSQIDSFIAEFNALPARPIPYKPYELYFLGRSTSPGSETYNKRLAKRRADAVAADFVSKANPDNTYNNNVGATGETGTGEDDKFRRVDVFLRADQDASQLTAPHEAGHMFGLPDEYHDTEAGRFTGDELDPEFAQLVRETIDEQAVEAVEVGHTRSMMSHGDEILRAHHTPFVHAIESLTSLDWTV